MNMGIEVDQYGVDHAEVIKGTCKLNLRLRCFGGSCESDTDATCARGQDSGGRAGRISNE